MARPLRRVAPQLRPKLAVSFFHESIGQSTIRPILHNPQDPQDPLIPPKMLKEAKLAFIDLFPRKPCLSIGVENPLPKLGTY
jgi:hypothetical protein